MKTKLENNREALRQYFRNACRKDPAKPRFGLEIEQFIIEDGTGRSLPYNETGLEGIMNELTPFYKDRTYSEDHLIELSREDAAITLEPAGQFEISFAPTDRLSDIFLTWKRIEAEMAPILSERGSCLCACGYQPHSRISDLPLLPKTRYRLMERYFSDLKGMGPNMMKGTASIHISVDYHSEEEMGRLYKCFYRILPILAHLTENITTFEGSSPEENLLRMRIWEKTDPKRVDVSPYLEADGTMTFEGYRRFLENAPVIVRQTEEGQVYSDEPIGRLFEEEDFSEEGREHLRSMVFPFIRLKDFLEIRVADSLPMREALIYFLLIKGLYLSLTELEAYTDEMYQGPAFDLFDEFEGVRCSGATADLNGKSLKERAGDLFRLAGSALFGYEKAALLTYLPGISENASLVRTGEGLGEPNILMSTHSLDQWMCQSVAKAMPRHSEAAQRATRTMAETGLLLEGQTVKGLYIPKLFSRPGTELLKEAGETMARIGIKAIRQFKKDPAFRALFGFDKRTEDMILWGASYTDRLPVLRTDVFYNEETGDYRICELNTDGTSGMLGEKLLQEAFLSSPLAEELARKGHIRSYELFDSLAKAYTEIYRSSAYAKKRKGKRPLFAVVDFFDKASSLDEFRLYAQAFERQGAEGLVADIRDLTYDGKCLCTKDGRVIDALYRRAVTGDILDREREVTAFLEAAREEKVVLLGSFETQVVHDKSFLIAITDPYCETFLTREEIHFLRIHVPETFPLTKALVRERKVREHPEKWVIKPMNGYSSEGVFMGLQYAKEEWQRLVEERTDMGYIAQAYQEPFASRHIDFNDEGPALEAYYNMTGIYTFDGRFAGLYARAGHDRVIATGRGAHLAASLTYEE